MNDFGGVGDVFIGQLTDVDESVLMDTDVNEGSEIGDICHNSRQFHAFVQVFNGLNTGVELEGFNLFAGVTAGFLQLFHDIRKGGESNVGGNVSLDINLLARTFIINKVSDRAVVVLSHLFDDVVALRVYGAVVEWILGFWYAQESSTLLIGGRTESGYFFEL